MAFKRMKGVVGLVYVPDDDGGPKKHPCPDCHFCQWCSDERCRVCLKGAGCTAGRKRKGCCKSRARMDE